MKKFNIGSSAAGFVFLKFKTYQMMNKQILINKIKETSNESFSIYDIPFRYLFDNEIIACLAKYRNDSLRIWLMRVEDFKISKYISLKEKYIKVIENSKSSIDWNHIPFYIRSDKKLISELISKNHKCFKCKSFVRNTPFNILNDPEIKKKLIKYGIPLHQGIAKTLSKDDFEQALKNGCLLDDRHHDEVLSIKHLSSQLRDDKDIASIVIDKYPNQIQYLSRRIRGDKDIISKALKKNRHHASFAINLKKLSDEDLEMFISNQPNLALDDPSYGEILNICERGIKLSSFAKDLLYKAATKIIRRKNNGNTDIFELGLFKRKFNKIKTLRSFDYKKQKDECYEKLKKLEEDITLTNTNNNRNWNYLNESIKDVYFEMPHILKRDFGLCREILNTLKPLMNHDYELDFNQDFFEKMIHDCPKIEKFLIVKEMITRDMACEVFWESNSVPANRSCLKKYYLRKFKTTSQYIDDFGKLDLDPQKDKDLIFEIYSNRIQSDGRHETRFWKFAFKHYSLEDRKNIFLRCLKTADSYRINFILDLHPPWRSDFDLIKATYMNNFECLDAFWFDFVKDPKFNKFIASVNMPWVKDFNVVKRTLLIKNRLFIAKYISSRNNLDGRDHTNSLSIAQLILREHSYHNSISDHIIKLDPRDTKYLHKKDFYKIDTTSLNKDEKIYVYNAYRVVASKSMKKHSKFKEQLLSEVA